MDDDGDQHDEGDDAPQEVGLVELAVIERIGDVIDRPNATDAKKADDCLLLHPFDGPKRNPRGNRAHQKNRQDCEKRGAPG